MRARIATFAAHLTPLLLAVGVCHAQTPEATPAPAAQPASTELGSAKLALEHPLRRWVVSIEPMVWAPGLRGDIELPGSSSIDVESIGADETQIAPAGRATIRAGRLGFQIRGFGFTSDEDERSDGGFTLAGAAVAPGTSVESDIELYSFDGVVSWELPPIIDNPQDEVRLAFDITGGARVTSVDMDVRLAGGGGSSADNVWAMPILGARMNLDLPHRLGLGVSFDAGWLPSDSEEAFTWDVTASFFWMALENVGLEIGFRHLQSDLQDGDGPNDSRFDASLAGLFGAIVIRF